MSTSPTPGSQSPNRSPSNNVAAPNSSILGSVVNAVTALLSPKKEEQPPPPQEEEKRAQLCAYCTKEISCYSSLQVCADCDNGFPLTCITHMDTGHAAHLEGCQKTHEQWQKQIQRQMIGIDDEDKQKTILGMIAAISKQLQQAGHSSQDQVRMKVQKRQLEAMLGCVS